MFDKKSIEDVNVRGKRVLVRSDFNVPIDENGAITDNSRVVESLPTIRYLMEQGAKVILCSHRGRPKGKTDPGFSLQPVAKELGKLLGRPVPIARDVVGDSAKELASRLRDGDVMLLENVRFEPGEEKNDPAFAKELALLADLYVNDAFGTAHRAHASTAGVAAFLPAVCGFLIQKEITVMGEVLQNPQRPFLAIMGGAKVSDKIGVISHLLEKVDLLLLGGGMIFTFIKAQGGEIGASLFEEDKIELAVELMEKARATGAQLLLPVDVVAANRFAEGADTRIVPADKIPAGWMGLDIGPETVRLYQEKIRSCGTVLWNGPMGVFEFEKFAGGTRKLISTVAETDCISIVGGGDTAAAVSQMGYKDQVTFVSTGGGATLEFLEGVQLPGIACLTDRSSGRL